MSSTPLRAVSCASTIASCSSAGAARCSASSWSTTPVSVWPISSCSSRASRRRSFSCARERATAAVPALVLEPVEHRVERVAELGDLGIGALEREPAAGRVRVDPAHHARELLERPEDAPHQQQVHRDHQHGPDGQDDRLGELQRRAHRRGRDGEQDRRGHEHRGVDRHHPTEQRHRASIARDAGTQPWAALPILRPGVTHPGEWAALPIPERGPARDADGSPIEGSVMHPHTPQDRTGFRAPRLESERAAEPSRTRIEDRTRYSGTALLVSILLLVAIFVLVARALTRSAPPAAHGGRRVISLQRRATMRGAAAAGSSAWWRSTCRRSRRRGRVR